LTVRAPWPFDSSYAYLSDEGDVSLAGSNASANAVEAASKNARKLRDERRDGVVVHVRLRDAGLGEQKPLALGVGEVRAVGTHHAVLGGEPLDLLAQRQRPRVAVVRRRRRGPGVGAITLPVGTAAPEEVVDDREAVAAKFVDTSGRDRAGPRVKVARERPWIRPSELLHGAGRASQRNGCLKM
jgi:hypothetical protein